VIMKVWTMMFAHRHTCCNQGSTACLIYRCLHITSNSSSCMSPQLLLLLLTI
jgi:hypothetical protein